MVRTERDVTVRRRLAVSAALVSLAAGLALAVPQPAQAATRCADGSTVVPEGTTEMAFTVHGGAGGDGSRASTPTDEPGFGGRGATVTATVPVTPGETISWADGQDGTAAAGALGGGLPYQTTNSMERGGGGGGAGVVWRGAGCFDTLDPSTALIVAGGGGGGGAGRSGETATAFPDGGNAGLPGAAADPGLASAPTATAGGGGTQTQGGVGGTTTDTGAGCNPEPAGQGDAGGAFAGGGGGRYGLTNAQFFSACGNPFYGSTGAGGGGGWFGGGGGAGGSGISPFTRPGPTGAGGGSSWVAPAATAVSASLVGSPRTHVPIMPRLTMASGANVVEGQPILVTLSLTAPAPTAFSHQLTFGSSSTANSTDLLVSFPRTVSWAVGEQTKVVSIPTKQDGPVEPTETVIIALGSVPSGVPTSTTTATWNLLDGGFNPQLSYTSTSSTFSTVEGSIVGGGTVLLPMSLKLNVATNRVATVHWATSSGTPSSLTATPGVDYVESSGDVSFPIGATTASFTIPVMADRIHESNESFTVRLSSPLNLVLPSTTTATATIIDDDPVSNGAPTGVLTVTADRNQAPAVGQIGIESSDPENDPLAYSITWGDGGPASTGSLPTAPLTHAYPNGGTYPVLVTITDPDGLTWSQAREFAFAAPGPLDQRLPSVRGQATPVQLGVPAGAVLPVSYTYAAPLLGAVSCDAAGACSYVVPPGSSASDSFTFQVSDAEGTTTSGTIFLDLANEAPVAAGASVDVPRRVVTPISLGASDGNGDTLTFVAPVSGPAKGQLTCTGPSCTYVSDPGATGSDAFTFQVSDPWGGTDTETVVITLTNTAPTAAAQALSTPAHAVTPITLGGADANGDALTYSVQADPTKGTVSCSTGGACSYRSEVGATGTDHFTFAVDDGNGGADTAEVDISLSNDAPVASPQSVSAPRRVATPIWLSGTDANDDPLTITAPVTGPSKGDLVCEGAVCAYTSAPGATGTDSFTFRVEDGSGLSDTATVSITLTNTAPVGLPGSVNVTKGTTKSFSLQGFDQNGDALTYAVVTPPARGTLSCTGASCSYTATGAIGPDPISFTVTDPSGATSVPSTVSISITPPTVTIGDAQAMEPNAGTAGAVYVPVSLSAPLASDVTVSYWTQDGTATGGVSTGDYRTWGTPAQPRTMVIKAGATWGTVSPPIFSDAAGEPEEAFSVRIGSVTTADGSPVSLGDATGTVTIVDAGSSAGDPQLSVLDQRIYEGDLAAGQRAQFSIAISKPLAAPMTLQMVWADGTAQRGTKGTGADWAPPVATTLVLPAGSVGLKTIDLSIWGDGIAEGDETLTLTVLPPNGAPVVQRHPTGTLTIANDD